MREGGKERTTFRLIMEVQQLQATLNYEVSSAAALALTSIEDVRFTLGIHPATMGLSASLGNLRAQDGTLAPVSPSVMAPGSWLHASGHQGAPCQHDFMLWPGIALQTCRGQSSLSGLESPTAAVLTLSAALNCQLGPDCGSNSLHLLSEPAARCDT